MLNIDPSRDKDAITEDETGAFPASPPKHIEDEAISPQFDE